MGFIAKPIGYLLTFLYDIIGNYGITLLVLTFVVKICLYPLYAKQIKSTAKMASVQPKMKEIQKKYANDRDTMNEKIMELYKEEGFSPYGGCLPMLIQMPIIMGLFALLRMPLAYINSEDMLFAFHESFLWIPDLAQPDPWILPVLSGVATFLSFSMNQTNMTQLGGQGKAMNLMMKYFFPITIVWLARSYPAGLAIYWFGSQFMQIFFNLRFKKLREKAKFSTKSGKKKKAHA